MIRYGHAGYQRLTHMCGPLSWQFLDLAPSAVLADMVTAGTHLCSQEWSEVTAANSGLATMEVAKYCFSSAYSVAVLHDALGVGMEDNR